MAIKRHRFLFCFFLSITTGLLGQQPELVLPIGHSNRITDVAESANGKLVVTASYDGTAKLWDRSTAKLLHTFVSGGGIESISLSPDNKHLAAGSEDSTIFIWEINTGKLIHRLSGFTNRIDQVRFIDETQLFSSSYDCSPDHLCASRTTRIWSITTGKMLEEKKGNTGAYYTSEGSFVWVTENELIIREKGNKDSIVINIPGLNGVHIFRKKWDGFLLWKGDTFIYCDKKGVKKGSVKMPYLIGEISVSADENKILLLSERTPYAEVRNFGDTSLIRTFGINEYDDRKILGIFHPEEDIVFVTAAEIDSCWVRDVSGNKREYKGFPITAYNDTRFRFTNDGKFFYSTGAYELRFWELNRSSPAAWFRGHSFPKQKAEPVLDDSLLLVVSDTTNVEAWDPKHNKLLYALGEKVGPVRLMEVSYATTKFVTLDHQNILQHWDTRNGKLLQTINVGNKNKYSASSVMPTWAGSSNPRSKPSLLDRFDTPDDLFSKIKLSRDGQFVAAASEYGDGLGVWDLNTGKLAVNVHLGADGVFDFDFSPDGNKLVAVGRDDVALLVDLQSRKITDLNPNGIDTREFIRFTPSGKQIILSADDFVIFYDPSTGKELDRIPAKGKFCGFSPDGQKMIMQSLGGECNVWNLSIKKLVSKATVPRIDRVSFLNDPDRVFISFLFGEAPLLLNLLTGVVEYRYTADMAGNAVYDRKNKLITTVRDNKVHRWNAATGKLVSTFFSVGKSDHFAKIPEGYYQSTPNACKLLHYVTSDFRVISFEQLDIKYNRPDLVLKAMGNDDTTMISSYRKAYEKRIKKLGIDTTAFKDGYSVPEADFASRDNIEYEQKTDNLTLHINGNDSTYKLDRFNVWVNEAPVYGQRGVSLRTQNKSEFDTTITIKLSHGENRIETSISNVNGTESYRMPLILNYTPAVKQKEMTRFIGIGIDKFADNEYNLQYSSKDIRDLAKKLKEKYGNDIIIDTLFNEKVTISNVKALKQKLLQTSENDKVIIAYSGHGMLSKEYDYYLSTYSVNFEKPEENGLPYDELENLLDSIPARKKLLLIDACHSGEVDKEDLIRLNASSDSLKKGVEPVAYKQEGRIGLKNSFELMQSLFVNVGKSTGATIISAAAGTQFALERNDLKNGVFTYSILEAMNTFPTMKISELKKIVGERVEQLTKGLQKPTSRNETIAVDWNIW